MPTATAQSVVHVYDANGVEITNTSTTPPNWFELEDYSEIALSFTGTAASAWRTLVPQIRLTRRDDAGDQLAMLEQLLTDYPWLFDPSDTASLSSFPQAVQDAICPTGGPCYDWDETDMSGSYGGVLPTFNSLTYTANRAWVRPGVLGSITAAMVADSNDYAYPQQYEAPLAGRWRIFDQGVWYTAIPVAPAGSLWMQTYRDTIYAAGQNHQLLDVNQLVRAAIMLQAPTGTDLSAVFADLRNIRQVGYTLSLMALTADSPPQDPIPAGGYALDSDVPSLPIDPSILDFDIDLIVNVWTPPLPGDGEPVEFVPIVAFDGQPGGAAMIITWPYGLPDTVDFLIPTDSGIATVTASRIGPLDSWLAVSLPADTIDGTVTYSLPSGDSPDGTELIPFDITVD